ncbi:glycosyltransferase [Shewanella litoralis]|uniref:Poly(Glycerol-phosphate) alpha-glucosyltransferase n=1 Tax=Shewanella litoralis TaxID=2282700 RepID=A0ABQ2RAD1_9GAMM|nr:glycosyltransferase [Shewanella litoralis]GGQ16689.1 poly(glycerol-phosphate) alpha-glucosyltransferase [Shewanella litoralis]
MKLCINVPTINTDGGGVATAVIQIYNNLSTINSDYDICIKTINSGSQYELESRIKHIVYKTVGPKRLGFSIQLLNSVFQDDSNILHCHGTWMANTIYNNLFNNINKKPYVISPHGMLDSWILSRGKTQKLFANLIYEKSSRNNAFAFHALNSTEADSILKINPKAKIFVIPNGIDTLKINNYFRLNPVFNITFLGRFHEKKNIINLICSILDISEDVYRKKPFILNLAGWGDVKLVQKIKELIQIKPERFNFIGPVYGKEKEMLFKNTNVFILPSFSEGLPMAVLEAWAYGTPVMMTKHCNLSEAFNKDAALECPVDREGLKKSLLRILLSYSPEDLSVLASLGHKYVSDNYSWRHVTSLYDQMYKEICLKC